MGVAAAVTRGWVCLRRCAKSASVLTTPNPPLMLRRLFSTARRTSVVQRERGWRLTASASRSQPAPNTSLPAASRQDPSKTVQKWRIVVCGCVVSPVAFAVRGRCGGPGPPPPRGSASSPHCNRPHHTPVSVDKWSVGRFVEKLSRMRTACSCDFPSDGTGQQHQKPE